MAKKIIKDNLSSIDVDNEISLIVGNNFEEGNRWYGAANNFIKAATILYDNNLLSLCVYNLQQAVECTIKGTFIDSGVSDDTIVKNISHAPEEAYLKFYEQQGSTAYVDWCNQIIDCLNNATINNFQDKLEFFKHIINNIILSFNSKIQNCILDNQSVNVEAVKALGFNENMPVSMFKIYLERIIYVQNMLFALSLLFKGTQQNTRYPMIESDTTAITPQSKYDDIINREDLKAIIGIVDSTLSHINADRKFAFR